MPGTWGEGFTAGLGGKNLLPLPRKVTWIVESVTQSLYRLSYRGFGLLRKLFVSVKKMSSDRSADTASVILSQTQELSRSLRPLAG